MHFDISFLSMLRHCLTTHSCNTYKCVIKTLCRDPLNKEPDIYYFLPYSSHSYLYHMFLHSMFICLFAQYCAKPTNPISVNLLEGCIIGESTTVISEVLHSLSVLEV